MLRGAAALPPLPLVRSRLLTSATALDTCLLGSCAVRMLHWWERKTASVDGFVVHRLSCVLVAGTCIRRHASLRRGRRCAFLPGQTG
eukprot:3555300-Rhodomonas_salina.2